MKAENDLLKEQLKEAESLKERLKEVDTLRGRVDRRNQQLKTTRKSVRKLQKTLDLTEERCTQMGYDAAVLKAHQLGFDHVKMVDASLGMTDPVGRVQVDEPLVVSSGEDEPLSD